MSRKRGLEATTDGSGVACNFPFSSRRDKELFDLERNLLARIVYKNQYQFRRIDFLDRLKKLVKDLDEFMVCNDPLIIAPLLNTITLASERVFQSIAMGLIVPICMVCVAALARLAEILQKCTQLSNENNLDEGVPIER